MPNRILREGILTSDRIDRLDAAAEVFYRRLMSKVDDFGLHDARPSILRSFLYPLRADSVREADIARWIAACEKAGVIALYAATKAGSSRQIAAREMAGLTALEQPYLQMLDTEWQTRSEPKCPLPPWGKGAPAPAVAGNCAQPLASAPVFGDGVGDVVDTPPPPDGGSRFDEFWSLWPSHPRKVAKKQCLAKWRTQGCEQFAERVIAALRAALESAAWAKSGGEFIPAPLVWLNQARWEAPTEAQAQSEHQAAHWAETRSGIDAKAVELGLAPWDEQAFNEGRGEPFPAFKARVFKAAGEPFVRAA